MKQLFPLAIVLGVIAGETIAQADQLVVRKDDQGDLTRVQEALAFSEPGDVIELADDANNMFRHDPARSAGLDRGQFMKALQQEGVPCSGGYGRMNKDAYVMVLAKDKHFLKIYGEKTLKQWLKRSHCPQNDQLCEEAVWFTQNMLLGSKTDMEQIAEAIRKVQAHADELVKD